MIMLAMVGTLVSGPTLRAQAASPDSVRRLALSLGQTRPDSARALVRGLLAAVPVHDSLYPGILLAAGRLSSDAPTVATYLQRIVIEYGRSVWADSALLLLTQLYFAQGDPSATAQAAERMRRDYPDSPLKPRADFWGARGYFDLKDDVHGCALISEALAGPATDVEFQNQVAFYAPRCNGQSVATPPPTPAPAPAVPTPAPPPGAPAPSAPPTTFAVQVLAVRSAPQVDQILTQLKMMGFAARVVRDTSGLFKVRVGHYATRDEAQRVERRLKTRLGGQPFVVEEP
jgi:cell division septation protein DedD